MWRKKRKKLIIILKNSVARIIFSSFPCMIRWTSSYNTDHNEKWNREQLEKSYSNKMNYLEICPCIFFCRSSKCQCIISVIPTLIDKTIVSSEVNFMDWNVVTFERCYLTYPGFESVALGSSSIIEIYRCNFCFKNRMIPTAAALFKPWKSRRIQFVLAVKDMEVGNGFSVP